MKLLYIILDGLGDRPCRELKGKTPLEAAKIPNLDELAAKSKCGIMYPIAKNIAPESDEAMLALLGFDPFHYHTGRGPLEAYGAGIKFEKGNVVLRCNFIEEKNGIIIDTEAKPRAVRPVKGTKFVKTIGHRGVLILTEKNLSPKISNTNPSYKIIRSFVSSAQPKNKELKIKKCRALDNTSEARKSAKLVNNFIEKNKFIVTRGAGNQLPRLPKLKGRWALLADMPVEKAIGKLTGMTILKKEQDLKKVANTVIKNLNKFDNFYFEIKGPDSSGHRGDAIGKSRAIEKIDKDFFGPLLQKINLSETVICVTADHSTPCEIMAHSADPVPLLVYSPNIRPERAVAFGEKACSSGELGVIKGTQLLKILEGLE